MTDEPQKSKRGGSRPGAGRKKKGAVPASAVAGVDLRVALAAPAPTEIDSVVFPHIQAALDTLYREMIAGQSDSVRVVAANEILDRGWGKPTVEAGGDLMLPFFGSPAARMQPGEIRSSCRKLTYLAVEVLAKIAQNSQSESARITAARSLLSRGLGAVAPALIPKGEDLRSSGKKEQLQQAAEAAAAGHFAPCAPPSAEFGTKH